MNNATIKAILKDKKPSTKWLQFYLNIYLLIVIVFEAASLPNISAAILGVTKWITQGEILETILVLTGILTAVTTVGAFAGLRNLTARGYKWNIAMLCSYFIRTALGVGPIWGDSGTMLRFNLMAVPVTITTGTLVWLIANLVYFRKRRHLFRTYSADEVEVAIQGHPPVSALPVHHPEPVQQGGIDTEHRPSTKWLFSYLNGYLFFMFAYAVYYVPNTLTSLPAAIGGIRDGAYWRLAGMPITILAGISAIIAFITTHKGKASAYRWNIIMMWSYSIAFVAGALLTQAVDPAKSAIFNAAAIAAIMLYSCVWLIPNLIYFKKRKHLFRPYTTAEVAAALKGEPPAPALPVRKPCRYQPSKAKVDTRKLWDIANGVTRFMELTQKKRQQ